MTSPTCPRTTERCHDHAALAEHQFPADRLTTSNAAIRVIVEVFPDRPGRAPGARWYHLLHRAGARLWGGE